MTDDAKHPPVHLPQTVELRRASTPARRRGPASLLARVLDTPNLPQQVRALPAAAFAKLVGRIGLEDSAELIALATTEQITEVLDGQIWRNARPGHTEVFDPDRFRTWLAILLEGGEAVVAQKLIDLPDDLVTLGFHRQMQVLRTQVLVELDDEEGDAVEKILASALVEELGEYQLVARVDDGWDDVFAALLAIDRDHHDFVVRLLERCCNATADEIDDRGGLVQALAAGDSLEDDVAGERDDRRTEAGYVAPADAAAFLRLAREPFVEAARDPLTSSHFRRRSPVGRASEQTTPNEDGSEPAADLLQLLVDADVLDRDESAPRLALGGSAEEEAAAEPLLIAAMRRLAEEDGARFTARAEEIAYLANVLVAGCTIDGRRLKDNEAAEAVIAACSLGLDLARDGGGLDEAVAALGEHSADALFRRAWSLVATDLVGPAAELTARLLDTAARDEGIAARAAAQGLRRAAAVDSPWKALAAVDILLGHVEDDLVAALRGLLDECPSLVGRLSRSGVRFVATIADLERARAALRC